MHGGARGTGMSWDPHSGMVSGTYSNFDQAMNSWSDFSGSIDVTSEQKSWHEALVLMPILGQELKNREFWSFQEQHFKQMAELMSLATQHAIIKLVDQKKGMRVKIRTIIPYPEDQEKIAAAYARSQQVSSVYLPFAERLALHESRVEGMLEAPKVEFVPEVTTVNWFEVVDESAPEVVVIENPQPVRKKRKKER
jgi:hypothetical protein